MCLKRLDIQGFKSFGDRVKLEFHPGLSVVVGPNGSGKSNISDAISWCLGEHKASSLRGSKMEDIIFAGTDKRKPVGMAEVTLTLDNAAKIFSLPYEEISVTRRLYRSGESEFLINKVPCRLKDIQALFMDTGLGRGAYSLIGQGKVDEILSSRPEERRSVIEEAAGIVKYRHRKEEALRKLSSAQQDLNRVCDILDELANRLEPLAIQAEKASQYKILQHQASQLELSLFRREWEDLNNRANEITKQLENIKAENPEIKANIEKELEQAKTRLIEIEEEITKAKERTFALETNTERVKNKLTLINEQIEQQSLEHKRVEEELTDAKEMLGKIIKEIDLEKEKHARVKEELRQETSDVNLKALEQLEKQIEEKQALYQSLNTDLIDQLNLVANQRNTSNQAGDRKEQLRQRVANLNNTIQEVNEKEVILKKTITGSEENLQQLKQKKASLISINQSTEEELTNLNKYILEIQAKHASVKEQMVAKHSRLKMLEENLSSHAGFMRPVRELLKVSNYQQAGTSGICGAVADLIKVPKGYENAMEAALGSALQNVVTETSWQAKESIEYLKKHNLGRATFLPLDSLRPAPPGDWEKKSLSLEGVIGLGSDLVEADPKYRSVIELLLGRLVVVDSLDNAIKVARKMQQRLRLVTLTGELLNPGGSLSGGSQARNTGGVLHNRRERDELVKEVQDLHQQVNQINAEVAEKQQLQQVFLSKVKENQSELVALRLEMQAAEMNLAKEKEELKRTLERNQESLWEIANLEQEINHWASKESEALSKLNLLEQELTQLQKQIADMQEALTVLRDQKTQLENIVQREKVRMAELRQELIGLQKIISRMEKDIEEKQTAVSNGELQSERLIIKIQELKVQQQQLQIDLQGLEGEYLQSAGYLEAESVKHQTAQDNVRKLEELWQATQEKWLQVAQKIHNLEIQQAKIQTEVELLVSRLEECGIDDPVKLTIEPATNKRQAKQELVEIKNKIADLGPVNTGAEAEYQEVTERHNFLLEQKKDLEESKKSLLQLINELNRLMSSQFESAFKAINQNFGTVFQQLFGGGGADMTLTEGETLSCGIEIIARPPGKKNQSLSLLSGGERALTAIALLFAILKYKPSPFCVLDEIEASLDEANVKRFADYLSRTSDEVQFIVISHRKGTMEKGHALYGVTMDELGVTRLLSMSLEEVKGNRKLA